METLYDELEHILDKYIRPELEMHGGNIVLTDIRDDTAYVVLTGHCSACPAARYTVESLVKGEMLQHTAHIKNLVLQENISQELIDLAKQLIKGRDFYEGEV